MYILKLFLRLKIDEFVILIKFIFLEGFILIMDLSLAKKIELTDKSLFDSYFLEFKPQISEFTFTNLFMWRKYYDFLFTELNDHLIIFSKNYLSKWKKPQSNNHDVIFFLPPVGKKPDEIIFKLFDHLDNIEIHRVSEEDIKRIKGNDKITNFNLEIIDDRDNWDYVYEKEELVSLAGNKYRQKRRWLKKFCEQYDYKFNFISGKYIKKARQLQYEWSDMNDFQTEKGLKEEQKAIDEIFDNFLVLNPRGGILCTDENCVGYTLGERLNNNTFVIHIEKAHLEYEGSYQAINNLFLKSCCKKTIFINREQDLGIPGLKKAKESYKPNHMIKKYIIFKQ